MTDTMLAVSVPADFKQWSLGEICDLEDQLGVAKEIVSDFIDGEVRRLVGEGWTQTRIAEECGRSQKTISRRMERLGIEPASNRGRPRISPPSNSVDPAEPEEEEVTGEIIEPDPDAPPSMYMTDVVAHDADDNLRTQAVHWYDQGRRLQRLLDSHAVALPKTVLDRDALMRDADLMITVANRLKEAIRGSL